MNENTLLRVAAEHCHQERIENNFTRQCGLHGPTHDLAGVKVDHDH
jgi:hypothetical protein